jgi:hypothetical protein
MTATASHSQLTEKSESELIYDWQFTINQFALAPSLLRLMTKGFSFLQLNPYGHNLL